jgi:hypothetical protein
MNTVLLEDFFLSTRFLLVCSDELMLLIRLTRLESGASRAALFVVGGCVEKASDWNQGQRAIQPS